MKKLFITKLTTDQKVKLLNAISNSPKISTLSMQERCIFDHVLSKNINEAHDHSTISSLSSKCNLRADFTQVLVDDLINKGIFYVKKHVKFISFDFFQEEVDAFLKSITPEKAVRGPRGPYLKGIDNKSGYSPDEYRQKICNLFIEFNEKNKHLNLRELADIIPLATGTISQLRSKNISKDVSKILSITKWREVERAIIKFDKVKVIKSVEKIEIKPENSPEKTIPTLVKEKTPHLMPKIFFEQSMKIIRKKDIKEAIIASFEYEREIPIEWVKEYNEIISQRPLNG